MNKEMRKIAGLQEATFKAVQKGEHKVCERVKKKHILNYPKKQNQTCCNTKRRTIVSALLWRMYCESENFSSRICTKWFAGKTHAHVRTSAKSFSSSYRVRTKEIIARINHP
jgi:hypothetical protein